MQEKSKVKKVNLTIGMVYFIEALVAYAINTVLSYYLGVILHVHPIWIGMIGSIGLLPMLLKILIGPLMDKHDGPFFSKDKRSWILLGMMMNGVFLALFSIDILGLLVIFLIIFVLQTLGIVIMDVAADALAVISKQQQAGTIAASVMFIGQTFGGITAMLFSGVFEPYYSFGFFVFGIIALLFIPMFLRVTKGIKTDPVTPRNLDRQSYSNLFKTQDFWLVVIIAFMHDIDGGLLEFTLEPFIGLALQASLRTLNVLNFISLIGVIVLILVFVKYKQKVIPSIPKILIVISAYVGTLMLALSFLVLSEMLTWSMFVILYFLIMISSGISNMTLYAFFVEHSSISVAASSMVILITAMNLGKLLGVFLSGFIPIGIIFLISASLLLSRIFPLLLVRLHKVKSITSGHDTFI